MYDFLMSERLFLRSADLLFSQGNDIFLWSPVQDTTTALRAPVVSSTGEHLPIVCLVLVTSDSSLFPNDTCDSNPFRTLSRADYSGHQRLFEHSAAHYSSPSVVVCSRGPIGCLQISDSPFFPSTDISGSSSTGSLRDTSDPSFIPSVQDRWVLRRWDEGVRARVGFAAA